MVRSSAIAVPATLGAIDLHLFWPMTMGLLAVLTARVAFVDRENRGRAKHTTFREFAPLTAVAMLIEVAVIIWHDLPVPLAIFYGLGIGFATILILDTIGDRIQAAVAALLGISKPAPPPPTNIQTPPAAPPDMHDTLREIDAADEGAPKP